MPRKHIKAIPAHLSRSAIAERLLDLEIQIAPQVAKIGELKEDLRFASDEAGQGFTEEIAGKGVVEVRPSRPREFKGTMPKLNPDAWLKLSAGRQDTLVEQGLVTLEQQFSPADLQLTERHPAIVERHWCGAGHYPYSFLLPSESNLVFVGFIKLNVENVLNPVPASGPRSIHANHSREMMRMTLVRRRSARWCG